MFSSSFLNYSFSFYNTTLSHISSFHSSYFLDSITVSPSSSQPLDDEVGDGLVLSFSSPYFIFSFSIYIYGFNSHLYNRMTF